MGKKLALSLGLIMVSAAYVVWLRVTSPVSPAATVPTTPIDQPTPTPQPTPAPGDKDDTPIATNPSPAPTPSPKPSGLYVDGSYTGSAVDAYYGMLQVKAVVSGGKLADVQFLEYPSDRGTSLRISTEAVPILKQEAIAAQSAAVSGVSGATETSAAFVKSLASALVKAKK